MRDNLKVPEIYRGEFCQRQASLIRSRVRLFCILTIAIYFSVSIISIITSPAEFKPAELPTWAMLIAAAFGILYINRKVSSLLSAKLNAWAFTVVLIACLTYVCIVYYEYINEGPAIYLFLLFLISFTMPWTGLETIPISLLHMAAYSVLFFYVMSRHNTASLAADLSIARYSDGMTVLLLGGVLSFVMRRKETARDMENFLLLKEVESKNKQMQKELELATRIHKTLIPHSVSTDMVDIAVMYLPMYYIGGDYAKFHFIDKQRLLFIICDVTGHGVSAALLVNRIHTEFERLAREGKEPGLLLKELNDFITKDFEGINMYLSAFCGLLDFKKMRLSYSNHGHPSQYIYRITKSDVQRLASQTTLLGLPLAGGGNTCQNEIDFSAGDKILLFTDGVIETKNGSGESYDETRIEGFIKANAPSLDAEGFNRKLLDELNAFKDGDFSDDIFILSIHVK